MAVTVQQGSSTISSMEDDGAAVLANLEALDKSSETPAPPAETPVEPGATQAPAEAGEGSAAQRARDEAGRFTEKPPEKAAKPEPAEKRIAKITWEREEAKRQHAAEVARREALEARIAALEKTGAPSPEPRVPGPDPQKTEGEPQLENFESYEQYTRALAKWEVRQELAQARQQDEQAKAKSTHEEQTSAFRERFYAWADKNKDKPDDAQAMAAVLKQPMSPAMLSVIIGHEQGPELLHYLALHPQECLQLVEETQALPDTAAPVVRRALERFLTPSAAPTGPAKAVTRYPDPAPIQPVGASPVVPETDPNALDGWAYVNAMNKRDFERERVRRGLMK